MPRKHPPRTTTLYLPPPEQVEPPTPPSLEVLLAAQQIAHERGHAFDIESFLPPAQRDEYLALLDRDSDKSGGGDTPAPEDEPAAKRPRPLSAGPAGPAPALQHWRTRLLAGQRTRSATPRIKPEPDTSSMPGTPTNHSLRDRDKNKQQEVVLPGDRPEIQASASYWNHLLVQARESRGPQWDYNTQMLMFDQHTDKYYSQGLPEPPTPPRPPPKKLPAVPNGEPNGDRGKEKGDKEDGRDKGKAPEPAPPDATPKTPARPPPAPSTPARPPSASASAGPSAPSTTPGNAFAPAPSPQAAAASPSRPPPSASPQLPPHLRMQAAAQANVQAQALALGQSGGFNLNPMLMQRPGISPMALMGGMGGMQMGQMGMPFSGPPGQQPPPQQGGQGPMVGGWGEFSQNE